MSEMIESAEEAFKLLLESDVPSLLAKVQKKMMDALVEEGFSKEEAIRIVIATPPILKT